MGLTDLLLREINGGGDKRVMVDAHLKTVGTKKTGQYCLASTVQAGDLGSELGNGEFHCAWSM